MDFAFAANAFREYGPIEAIEHVAAAGFDGIELLFDEPHLYPAATDDADVAAVADALDDHGLAISNCNAFMLTAIEDFHHPSFVEPDAGYRQQRVDYTRGAVELADAFDAPYISIEPGGPPPTDVPRDEAYERFWQALGQVMPLANDRGVDVLVEPEPDLLIETTDQYYEFRERVDLPGVGCNLDAGHLFCVGEDPAAYDALAEDVRHVHLEDIPTDRSHEHTQLGEGALDVNGFLTALEDAGYDGWVTVELYPYQETAPETARDAMAYLEEHGWQ
ncbi:MAG: sugar phosphate isomerase/epimerase family protein [Haloarculaceae archaeon]